MTEYIFAILFSYFIGKSILSLSSAPFRFGFSFFLGLSLIFIAFLYKQPKRFYLTLFFCCLPIVANKNLTQPTIFHIGGPSTIYFSFYDFPLAMLYFLLIPQAISLKKVNFLLSKEALCILGIISISILSMINSVNFTLSFYDMLRLIIIFMVFMYISNNINSADDIKCFIVPMLAGLLFISLIGIAQFFGIRLLGLRFLGQEGAVSFRAISRVGGTLGHPNLFAIYLGYFLPITLGLVFFMRKKIYKILCGIIFSLGLCVLILTLSRGGWIGFILSIVIFLVLALKAKLISAKQAVFFVILFILFLCVLTIFYHNIIFVRLFYSDYGAARSRIPLMQVALKMIEAHPFIGVGTNNYYQVMHLYGRSGIDNVVHNGYLLIAAQIGIPSLLILLYFIVLIYRRAMSLIHSKSRLYQCLSIGILSGLFSFLVQLTVENFSLTHQLFLIFWIMAGLIVAMSKMDNSNNVQAVTN